MAQWNVGAQLQLIDQYDSPPFSPYGHDIPLKGYKGMRLPVGIILIPPLVHVQSYFS